MDQERRGVGRLFMLLGAFVGCSLLAAVVVLGMLAPFVLLPAGSVKAAATWWESVPDEYPKLPALAQRTTLVDADGKPFATLFEQNRIVVTLDEVPQVMIDAVLSIEDDRFYERETALDVEAIGRAVVNNVTGGSRQGGSTIAQQYVKNLLVLTAGTEEEQRAAVEARYMRKIREARMALRAERELGKDGILIGYLNTVYLGAGSYGVAAAAQTYFSKAVADLTLPEAAMIAGLLQSPSAYDPTRYRERARDRRNVVLDVMARTGRITVEQAQEAKATRLGLRVSRQPNGCAVSLYPFYCQQVLRQFLTDPAFGESETQREEALRRGNLIIRTALRPDVLKAAEAAARDALEPKNRVATGIAVVIPGTGEVAAIATNRYWGSDAERGQTELVLPALPAYQPGSTFKPFVLATALEGGFDPETPLSAPNEYKPISLNHPPGGFHNYDDVSYPPMTAKKATEQSINTWYIQLIERTGVIPVASLATRMGITSLPISGPGAVGKKDAALALGTREVSPVDMAAAYATFASGGVACTATFITGVENKTTGDISEYDPQCAQVLDTATAATVTSILKGVLVSGTASGFSLPGRPSAGKTGTTNDNAATWFAGYTADYATAVWVGDPRGGQRYPLVDVTAYGVTHEVAYGRTIATPLWKDVMMQIHEGLPSRDFPTAGAAALPAMRVPNVVGMSAIDARSYLTANGYQVVSRRGAPPEGVDTPGGVVVRQEPEAGTLAQTGQQVLLRVSPQSP